MLKYFLATAALVLAGVPAAIGLTSNASFSRDVPVRVPEQAQTVSPTPGDDDGTPDRGRQATEAGDDRDGDVPRDERTEAGDDRSGEDRSGDDGGHHGDDDGSGHD
jgi:hypothetical protein